MSNEPQITDEKPISTDKEYIDKLVQLNQDLIALNKKLGLTNNSLMFENQRLREVSNHGAFLEYNDDPSSIKFVPLLGNIQEFIVNPLKPTKLMFTFQFSEFQTWAMNLHNLMIDNKDAVEIINKRDLE